MNRCKLSTFSRGLLGNMAVSGQRRRCNVPVKTYLLYFITIYIYIHLVLPLGAYKTQLGGAYTVSLVAYTVIVSCDFNTYCFICVYMCVYIYCVCVVVIVSLLVFFAPSMHSNFTIRKNVPSKCVTHAGFDQMA